MVLSKNQHSHLVNFATTKKTRILNFTDARVKAKKFNFSNYNAENPSCQYFNTKVYNLTNNSRKTISNILITIVILTVLLLGAIFLAPKDRLEYVDNLIQKIPETSIGINIETKGEMKNM